MKEGWKVWTEVEEKKEMRYQRMAGKDEFVMCQGAEVHKKGGERGQPCQK